MIRMIPVLLLAFSATRVVAGPHLGGTLILHANPAIVFSGEQTDCGQMNLTDCASATATISGSTPTVFFAVAAFPLGSLPRLKGITFGIDYPAASIEIDGYGSCSDLTVTDPGWPSPGTGVGATWGVPVHTTLVPVYWFAAALASGAGPASFHLIPHPTQGGYFADDSVPAELDPIAAFGSLGFGEAGSAPCPSDLPPIGACCVIGAPCRYVSPAECTSAGGSYQGDYTDCDPDPCPIYGACCQIEGSCLFLAQGECVQEGATFLSYTDCDPNPCPQPLGACCFSEGACSWFTRDVCEEHGGVYRGDFTDCTPNPCDQPPTGSCCFADGTCQVLTFYQCSQQGGGLWQEAYTCIPNPCPQPIYGACCLPEGRCVVTFEAQCMHDSGVYQGDNTSCAPSPCPTGACCFLDGSCQEIDYDSCVTGLGDFHGVGSLCATETCPAAGACCFPSGSCSVLFPFQCQSNGGAYQGDATDCDPNPCPHPCEGLRSAIAPTPPANPVRGELGPNCGGTLIVHTNPSLTYTSGDGGYCGQSGLMACADAVPQSDGASSTVIFVLAAFAPDANPRLSGVNFGLLYDQCITIEAWGSCGDFELPTANWPASGEGTALTFNVARTTHLTELYWFAAYTTDLTVDRLYLWTHPTQGGYFADDSTPALLNPILGYGYFGFGTDGLNVCEDHCPVVGACCQPGGECELTLAQECYGQFQGEGTTCDPDPCSFPHQGACCLGLDCVESSAADCANYGGEYQGDGTRCDPNPCYPPVPTQKSTWGGIKARYRD
ncbi:MAG: hypothetical protein U0527_05530 [Candidatus Eisenbacteria bacterium]